MKHSRPVERLDAPDVLVGGRFRYCGSFFRGNVRDIGKNCGRRRKRCAEKGSARVHESLLIPILRDEGRSLKDELKTRNCAVCRLIQPR
jgi:hypothetical protein